MSERGTWVYRDGRLVLKGGPDDIRPEKPRSHLPSPYYIADGLPDIRGMHDGKVYDSKSELRAAYKAAGVVELGNDAPTTPADNSKSITKAEIGAALQKVKQGYRPAPLETKVIPEE